MTNETIVAPKQAILDMVSRCDDSVTYDDIIEMIELRKLIEKRLTAIEDGDVVPHDKAMRKLAIFS